MSAFKKIRYGTAIKPFVVQRILTKFPSGHEYPLIDPSTVNHEVRPFGPVKAMAQQRFEKPTTSTTGYPSISIITSATDNLQKLYEWQLRMIHSIGIDGFKTFMLERMASGRLFHSVVETLLKELNAKGQITMTAEEALMKQKDGEKYHDKVIGYLTGMREYLCGLKANPLMRLEKPTHHPLLCYTGRFDAIVEIDGELTLVDWKTINAVSEKSRAQSEKMASDLYSNPIQIAAYVAAVNSDPAYKDMPPIKRAAVVLTYEDGRGVEVVSMNEEDIEQYFDELCRRLNKFWWQVENGKMRSDYVNFVYNPLFPEQPTEQNEVEIPAEEKKISMSAI